jgi:signal transduction histidine kinase
VAVALGIAAVTVLHLTTAPSSFVLHNLYQRLYYVPLLLAATWFGLRGGLLAAIACIAGYTPHIFIHWAHSPEYQTSQIVELAMFVVIATLGGALADRERRLRTQAEALAHERDAALRELEQTLETLRRTDRLATLGVLAATMAHEIKNPLGALAGALEIIDQDFPAGHPRREFVDILGREISRLNAVAGSYLAFGSSQPPRLLPLDANRAATQAVDLIRKMAARGGVHFELQLDPALPHAIADAAQVQQVLVNVLVNAVQAMPSGGTVAVATRRVDGAVEVSVRDHGAGLPAVGTERLFEPFFTTKQGGSGLGLAVSRQIVAAHGGRFEAANADGGGAVFRFTLVASDRMPA